MQVTTKEGGREGREGREGKEGEGKEGEGGKGIIWALLQSKAECVKPMLCAMSPSYTKVAKH